MRAHGDRERRPPRITALLLLAATLGWAGCMTERAVLTPGQSLTSTQLREEGLAVGGIVIVEEVEQARVPLVDALEQSLHHWRPDLAVLSVGRVRDQLGLKTYRRILMGYQNSGTFSEADRAEMAEALRNGARYLIFARVEKDIVNIIQSGSIKAGTTRGITGRIGAVLTSRTSQVRVTLYDVKEGRDVQTAVYASSSDNAGPDRVWRPNAPRAPTSIEIVIPKRDEDTGSDEPPPSATPTLVDAVVEGFRAFVRDLPPPEGPGADSVPALPDPSEP